MHVTCKRCGLAHPIPFLFPLRACVHALAIVLARMDVVVSELPGATSAIRRVRLREAEAAKRLGRENPIVGRPAALSIARNELAESCPKCGTGPTIRTTVEGEERCACGSSTYGAPDKEGNRSCTLAVPVPPTAKPPNGAGKGTGAVVGRIVGPNGRVPEAS